MKNILTPQRRKFLRYIWEDIRGFTILVVCALVLSIALAAAMILCFLFALKLFGWLGLGGAGALTAGVFGMLITFGVVSLVTLVYKWITRTWRDSFSDIPPRNDLTDD